MRFEAMLKLGVWLLCSTLLCVSIPVLAQGIPGSGYPPGNSSGSGGAGGPNLACTFSSSATGCSTPATSINVSSLAAASNTTLIVQCFVGASTTQTPLASTYTYTTGSGIVQTVSPSFSSSSAAGYCVVNANSTGPTGATGATGAAGAAGAAGSGNNAYCADATGSATVYTCPTPSPTVTTLSGLLLSFRPQTTNGATPTVNVSSLGAKSLLQSDCSTAISSAALVGGQLYLFSYNGTAFCQGSSSGGTYTGGSGIVVLGTSIATDPTTIPTKAVVQSGASNIATVTSSGTATVTATMNPTLGAYVQDQPLSAVANFTSMGSLNINGLGAKNVYDPTGTTTPITTVSGLSYDFKYLSTLNSGAGGFQCVSANCGSSSSVTFSPPYMVSGGTSYLNYGFAATLPPTTWTGVNCGSGCTFTTSGLNGALAFVSAGQALSGAEFYQGEYVAIGSTATLIVALDCTTGSNSNGIGVPTKARCGVGILNSSTAEAYTIGVSTGGGGTPVITSSHWSSATSLGFDTGTPSPVPQMGSPIYFKISYTGGTYTPFYSMNGYKWTQIDVRGSLSGFNQWMIFAEGTPNSTAAFTTHNLYSWSAQ